MATEILMPRLTDTMHEGLISRWYKKEGECVEEGAPLLIVETDKATVEINASASGYLLKILGEEGNSVSVGKKIAIIGERGEEIQSLLTAAKPMGREKREVASGMGEGISVRVKASPAAKRKAKAENVDLKEVAGSGDGGLITEKDITDYLKKVRGIPDASKRYGPQETMQLQGVRRAMAQRMALSTDIPQVTTVAEIDVSDLVELSREKSLTLTSFVVWAVVRGLRGYPLINASLDGETIVVKKYYNIGVSVATPRGLVVPVLHNSESKDIYQISKELAELAQKARENRLGLEDITGATFTVTNSGVFGALFFTPRINPPESAILGMGKTMEHPVVRKGEISIRSMMYLSLSYDHRIIDGETAVKFLQEVKDTLEAPHKMLL